MKNTPYTKACLTHTDRTAGCYDCDRVAAARAKRARKRSRGMLASQTPAEMNREWEGLTRRKRIAATRAAQFTSEQQEALARDAIRMADWRGRNRA